MSAPQHPQNEKDKESTCSLFNWYDVKCTLAKLVFPGSPFCTGNGLQDIDGYLYYPSFICTKEKITQARQYDWAENDTFLSSYPKSGTHFCALTMVLIANRGNFPAKCDLHKQMYSAEFIPGPSGDNSRDIMEPHPSDLPIPRVIISHMPQHHVKLGGAARFMYVMRDPVATLASLRRMEILMFGPHLMSKLCDFIEFNIRGRSTGWLDHVLGWWKVRDQPNILILNYEEMVKSPVDSVRKIASHMKVGLTEVEIKSVAEKMDKKWALENVDPYLFQAKTPFSPPERDGVSKSGFIVDSAAVKEKLSKDQEEEIRTEYTKKIKTLMTSEDPAVVANATSFYYANRSYFST